MQDHPYPVPGPPPGSFAPQQTDPRAGIDDAVAGLDDLDTLPLAEHVERFDAVHTEMGNLLAQVVGIASQAKEAIAADAAEPPGLGEVGL